MNDTPTPQVKTPSVLRYAVGIVLVLVLSLWAFYLLMRPPMGDIQLMAVFLSITAVISILVGYAAYRAGWMYRSPTIRWTLIGGYILASLLTFINVWMTARLMFASLHDLQLSTVLLLFAGGIAIALGFFLSAALTDRIRQLKAAANSIAGGNLNTRISTKGQDEIADLARAFNQMAAQLQDADRKQQEVERLRRDLIAWISHDLQTPLTSIRAIVEALADGVVDDPDTVKRYLITAQKDVSALSRLIDDLFQMAQLDAGGLTLDRADSSISDLVSDTLESFSELASRQGVTLKGSVEKGADPVWMDTQRIGQVLNNLVANALRHTKNGDTVEVRAYREIQDARVVVQDNGEGIQPQDISYIFERFYRGDKSRSRKTGGSGLGLAIARGIVEAHGGQISVESVPDQGTKFMFSIPIQENLPENP